MIKETCDKCKKSGNKGFTEKRYLYDNEFDLCDECQKIYDELEDQMSKMAIRKRQQCEIEIQKEAAKIMDKFTKKGGLIKFNV